MESSMPVYDSFKLVIEVGTPEKFSKLMQFCSENGIYVPPVPANPFQEIQLDTTKRTPTPEYKHFYGSAWLNKDGKTSVANVYDSLKEYAKNHKLLNEDGSIHLTAEMKVAYKTERNRVYPHDFPVLASQAF
ncbi:hypothetical protein EBR66_05525 [bacterium]|nr:hypothetical protein [bacterium]